MRKNAPGLLIITSIKTLPTFTHNLSSKYINEEVLNQTKKAEYSDKYEEVEKVKEKLIENQTHRFLSVAKQLEIEFNKIIFSERQSEEVILKEEINGLRQTIGHQKEVITKYTLLMKQWTKEFKELEEENKIPL
ncbi:hypothetical protein GLOIN_2v1647692 [Rhizophagus clarus]|uniref:Uncharacterized protein n=1 Tax=Rhizophagus clarus TaxID=94130 RepID=A0A8H3L3D0_9GLOM|nr:hypothetical protein GLOIN_2v1647692 [Rhizophagus clarus]